MGSVVSVTAEREIILQSVTRILSALPTLNAWKIMLGTSDVCVEVPERPLRQTAKKPICVFTEFCAYGPLLLGLC